MAQLKDTVVSGSLRATDSLLANTGQFSFLKAKTSSSSATLGTGTAAQVLMSGGSNNGIYWGTIDTADLVSQSRTTAQHITSQMTFSGTIIGSASNYGTTLPTSATDGQLFFQITDAYHELPSEGNTGQVLIKNSNDNYDVRWASFLPTAGAQGQALIKRTSNDYDVQWGSLTASEDQQTQYYVCGQSITPGAGIIYNTNITVQNSVLYGAAWNDYAEYRSTKEYIEPGRCIIENGDGTLSLSTDRLQAGAEIVSDTFGFAIGKIPQCNTPIAVSGRVLAYLNETKEKIKIGAPVCSGPHGTVSQMTEQEASQFPWLIIGTISSIPQEEEWGAKKIKVNGRIWIRVR